MEQRTILVIDDDATICGLLTEALADEGYTVRCALGMAALRIAQEHHPDCILLDVMMPLLDGGKLSQLLRSHPETARIPIIAMSAMPRQHAPAELRYDVWLGKPFDLLTVFSTIASLTTKGVGAAIASI